MTRVGDSTAREIAFPYEEKGKAKQYQKHHCQIIQGPWQAKGDPCVGRASLLSSEQSLVTQATVMAFMSGRGG